MPLIKKNKYREIVNKMNEIKHIRNFLSLKNQPFKFKEKYDSIIPLKLYCFWHTKDLPDLIKQNYNRLVSQHPRFEHFLFDLNDAREFIKNNFPDQVLNAYDSLIPVAFKCDLWRYCVLYINGGIYLDIKYQCINNFRFIMLTEKEYFTKDIDPSGGGIYNALIITLPKNNILLKAINQIVENVKNKYYGNDGLDPTGPMLLKRYFNYEQIQNLELKHDNYYGNFYINVNEQSALKIFEGYREEQKRTQLGSKHHSEFYTERNIYRR